MFVGRGTRSEKKNGTVNKSQNNNAFSNKVVVIRTDREKVIRILLLILNKDNNDSNKKFTGTNT